MVLPTAFSSSITLSNSLKSRLLFLYLVSPLVLRSSPLLPLAKQYSLSLSLFEFTYSVTFSFAAEQAQFLVIWWWYFEKDWPWYLCKWKVFFSVYVRSKCLHIRCPCLFIIEVQISEYFNLNFVYIHQKYCIFLLACPCKLLNLQLDPEKLTVS